MQFIFLCNPPKSGASRVCITFPQITQKILTEDIIQWLELITEIISFLQIFIVRKQHSKTKVLLTISLYCKDMVEPYYIESVQKQPFADVLQNRCSWKFCKIHRKTTMLEPLFNKVASLKRLCHKCLPMIFVKFSKTPIF